jgi:hypothetical protein
MASPEEVLGERRMAQTFQQGDYVVDIMLHGTRSTFGSMGDA